MSSPTLPLNCRRAPSTNRWVVRRPSTPPPDRVEQLLRTEDADSLLALLRAARSDRAAEGECHAAIARLFAARRGADAQGAITIEGLMRKWLLSRQGEVTAATYVRYENSLERFLRFLGPEATLPAVSCTEEMILRFRAARLALVSPGTVNADLNVLRFVFSRAHRQRLLPLDPTRELKDAVVRRSSDALGAERRAFTQQEIEALLQVADAEWRGLILFGLYTVQRLKDVALLTRRQVEGGVLRLVRGKTGSAAVVPLHPCLRAVLEARAKGADSAPLFPRAAQLVQAHRGRTSQLSNQFYLLLVKAGLAPKRSKANTGRGHGLRRRTNELSFHSLRHTGNTWLKQAGAGEAVVRDIVGHESTDVSRLYTHVDDQTKAAAINRMPAVAAAEGGASPGPAKAAV